MVKEDLLINFIEFFNSFFACDIKKFSLLKQSFSGYGQPIVRRRVE